MSYRVYIVDVGADGDVVEGLATNAVFESRWAAVFWIRRRVQSEGYVAPHYVVREDEAYDAALEDMRDGEVA